MKSVLLYTVGLVLCMLMLGLLPIAGEEEIYENVIRLHVLAHSDGEEDQADKLLVRDAILATYGSALAGDTTEEAAARVEALLPSIRELAENTLAAAGRPQPVHVSFTDEVYPERVYGALHFPAGTYHSLRVMIGEGVGQNWWCVLFPPLCVGSASEEVAVGTPPSPPAGLGAESWRLVSESGEYEIRFRVLEWLMGA